MRVAFVPTPGSEPAQLTGAQVSIAPGVHSGVVPLRPQVRTATPVTILLGADDWAELNAAFSSHRDPLTGTTPRDPIYDRLFTRIVMRAPAPIGLGS